jgi:hypothetical protein
MEDLKYLRSDRGTPQGGILSPLLANIALAAIEERYEQYVWPRRKPRLLTDAAKIVHRGRANRDRDRKAGRPVVFPIRYADDFILLVSAPKRSAVQTLPVEDGSAPVWHLFPVLAPLGRREELRAFLAARAVQTGVHYPFVIPSQKALAGVPFACPRKLANAEAFAARCPCPSIPS